MARRGEPEVRYTFRRDFSGGQNDTNSEVKVQPNEARSARNVEIERDGAVSKRNGASRLNPSATLTGSIGMIHQFRPSAGMVKLLVAHDDEIKDWDGANGFTALITGLTVNKIVLPSALRNILYLMNNADNPMVYWPDASTRKIYRPGAGTPASTLTDGGNIAGSISSGSFWARVRFVEQFDDTFFGEPNATPIQLTTSGPNTGRRLATIPTGPQFDGDGDPDYFITKRAVERTLVGGDVNGPYYIDGYINDNSTTTYDFTASDTQLLEKDLAPDVGSRLPFPKLWPHITYNLRLVGHDPSDPGSIIWSEIDEFGIISSFRPERNQLYLDIEDIGDLPVAVAKLGEYLVWYCGRSIHLMHIDEAGVGYSRRLGGHRLGFPNPRCVAELPNGHVAWSFKGPYFFSGSELIFIGEKIEGTIATIPKSGLSNMYHVHRTQEKRRQVRFIFPLSGTDNNFAAKYHYRRVTLSPEGFPTAHAWTFDDGFTAKSGTIALAPASNEEIEYSGDYSGKLYREDFGTQNAHHAQNLIDAMYENRWDDMESPHVIKVFEEAWIFISGEPPQSLNVDWETEFGRGPAGSVTLSTVDPAAGRYDVALYDQAVYAIGAAKVVHVHLGVDGVQCVGRYLKLAWKNNAPDQPWTVMAYLVKWHPDSDRFDEQS